VPFSEKPSGLCRVGLRNQVFATGCGYNRVRDNLRGQRLHSVSHELMRHALANLRRTSLGCPYAVIPYPRGYRRYPVPRTNPIPFPGRNTTVTRRRGRTEPLYCRSRTTHARERATLVSAMNHCAAVPLDYSLEVTSWGSPTVSSVPRIMAGQATRTIGDQSQCDHRLQLA